MPRLSRRFSYVLVIFAAIILVICIVSVWRYLHQSNSTQNGSTAAPSKTSYSESQRVAAPSDRVLITYTNTGFSPHDISVKKGTIVSVKNESSQPMQFSSGEHPTHRENPEMNLRVLAPGEATSYNAGTVGSWHFHNHLDETKNGTITVKES